MRITVLAVLCLALLPCLASATTVRQADGGFTLENQALSVSLDGKTGALSVLDKQTGARYRQPDSVRDKLQCAPGQEVVVLPMEQPVSLDGRLGEWAGTRMYRVDSTLLSAEKPWELDGDRDLCGAIGMRWDKTNLHVVFIVGDDTFCPGSRDSKTWWEADSVEWRVGWDQAGFMLDPKEPAGFLWGDWKDWAKASVRQVADFSGEPEALALAQSAGLSLAGRPGYIVETSTSIGTLITLQPVAAGRRFRVSFGINDADEPGKRSAQEYYPAGYVIGRSSTYAVGVLAQADGSMPAISDGRPPACGDVTQDGEDGVSFTLAADMPEATVGRMRCTARLPEGGRDLQLSASFPEGWQGSVPLMRGFVPDAADAEYVLALYGNGILIPANDLKPPVTGLSIFGNLDMPAAGIVSSEGGALCLFEDYDCSHAELQPGSFGDQQRLALIIHGDTVKGQRLPKYRTTWHFAAEDGIAPLSRRVREFCAAQGWVRTLRQKRAANPNEDLLLGAPDVWGSSGLAFAREARAAGIGRMLVSGSYSGDQIRAIKDLGYLVGEYDQYVDTDENTESYDGRVPTDAYVRIQSDGQKAQGWVTLDGSHRWFSRCSETALDGAKHEIPRVLAERPYNARFLDVHTAMGLVECYSPDHPCTRTEDRENKIEMLQWIRDQGLVVGGEHGRAWSAGVLDYQEGMMSHNPFFGWPAGHLVKVEKPEQIGDRYLKWGIGYDTRAPFFELAFHDCVVSTWYWGDSMGYLERVRPDLTDRKVAFTALYGTMPLMWATNLGLGFQGEGKARFLQAYRNCCKIHEAVGYESMTDFGALDADRSVQRSRFSDGTVVTVNFGPEPARISSLGRSWLVPTNGIVADGPGIHQHIALVEGQRQTYIERPDYRFLDSASAVELGGLRAQGPVTAQRIGDGRIRISLEPATVSAALDPAALDASWSQPARLVQVGMDLQPQRILPVRLEGKWVVLPVTSGAWQTFDLLYGDLGRSPELALSNVATPADEPVRRVTARLTNVGGATASVTVRAYWDAEDSERLAGTVTAQVPVATPTDILIPLNTGAVDGAHRLILVADSGVQEAVSADNRAALSVYVAPDFARWPWRQPATVDLLGLRRPQVVVQAEVDLTSLVAGQALDPNSVRLALTDAAGQPTRVLPTQFEPVADFDAHTRARGTLLAIPSGLMDPAEPVRCAILAAPAGTGLLPPVAHLDPATRIVTRDALGPESGPASAAHYSANIADGAVRPVSLVPATGPAADLIKQVVFSSSEAGWSEPDGKLTEFRVLSDGPVRTRVRTVKELRGGLLVTRNYSFYAGYFTVEASAPQRQTGLFSRVWYAAPGMYEDGAGNVRAIDGQGQAEGVGYANPKWYCFRNDIGAHACIALTPMSGQSFWDEGSSLGQLGFSTVGAEGTYAHVIGTSQDSADFARVWYDSLTKPPVLRIGP
jgi:hypothetical protein